MKKLLSLLIVAMLLMSMVSVTAYASQAGSEPSEPPVETSAEPTQEPEHVCLPTQIRYAQCNSYTHYVQVYCTCGTFLGQTTEEHSLAADGSCAKCGAAVGLQDHVHTFDHVEYSYINRLTHERQVYCDCGDIIGTKTQFHTFTGIGEPCPLCGGGSGSGGSGGSGGDEPSDEPSDEPGDEPGDKPGDETGDKPGTDPTGKEDKADKDFTGTFPEDVEFIEGEFDGNRYIIVYDDGITWEDAKKMAEEAGGHLMTITSKEEQKFIEELNDEDKNLWIGGFLNADTEAWEWVTDEEWEYSRWTKNNPFDDDEFYCTAIYPHRWVNMENDDVEELDGYIIEFDAEDKDVEIRNIIDRVEVKKD